MALATYADLQASVAAWLNRTDLSGVIPDFIALAESRIARDLRISPMIVTTTLTATPSVQTLAQPTGFLEYQNLSAIDSSGVAQQLEYVNNEYLDSKFPDPTSTGLPLVYSIEGTNILFGPVPDAAYAITAVYFKRYDPLSVTPTNWLLTNYASIYLHLSLMHGAMFLKDKQAATDWENLYMEAVTNLQIKDDTAARSGSSLRVRAL